MKILIPCSALDLKYKLGCTPSWWQLLKALHETGNEVIAVPYLGDAIEGLWWRVYPNPCSLESKVFNAYLDWKKGLGGGCGSDTALNRFAEKYVKGIWKKHLEGILDREKDVDALLFLNIPINHIKGVADAIKQEYGIPVAYLDGDMPTILPKYAVGRGFKFNYYVDADLSEYDAFFTNSKGVIPDLLELGAKNVHPLYYAADPDLFRPVSVEKDIDISFFGYGDEYREYWMKNLITEPSKVMSADFALGGKGFKMDIGRAREIGDLSYSAFREFCCRSKICLNITRWSHTNVYASSTARPFELAAYGSCIVSQPYRGIDEWFKPREEVAVAESKDEAIEIYRWLLNDPAARLRMGEKARRRICKEHTYRHRADELTKVIGRVAL